MKIKSHTRVSIPKANHMELLLTLEFLGDVENGQRVIIKNNIPDDEIEFVIICPMSHRRQKLIADLQEYLQKNLVS